MKILKQSDKINVAGFYTIRYNFKNYSHLNIVKRKRNDFFNSIMKVAVKP